MIQPPSNLAELRAVWRAVNDDPAGTEPGWTMLVEDVPRLYVNGMIGGYRMNAGTFVQQVHAITAPAIHLHINSPGGFVWDTVSMYEALRGHPATVTTHIDGLAGSAASFLALAGDRVEIARAGRVMIHDAQAVAYGSPAQIREAADLGDAISNDIAGIYAERAGGKRAAWRKAMTATTWYSAQQAVDAGLAHQVSGSGQSAPSNSGAGNRSRLIKARAAVTLGGVK
jgi:ATP-dependent protease ClpP protease subunit